MEVVLILLKATAGTGSLTFGNPKLRDGTPACETIDKARLLPSADPKIFLLVCLQLLVHSLDQAMREKKMCDHLFINKKETTTHFFLIILPCFYCFLLCIAKACKL